MQKAGYWAIYDILINNLYISCFVDQTPTYLICHKDSEYVVQLVV